MPSVDDAAAAAAPRASAIPHLRWIMCGLLFLATTINYVDRQALSVLNPIVLAKEIGWTPQDFAWIVFAFTLAYTLGFPVAGRLLDRVGVRAGMIVAIVWWSLAAMSHAFAGSVLGFAIARFFLGLGEAANFPACVKATAEWFPKRERAFATGIFNSGTNAGVMLSPAIVWTALHFGWQGAFLITGGLGLLWLVLWVAIYRSPAEHPRLSPAERAIIESDLEPEPPAIVLPWTWLVRKRQAWAFFLAKGLSDPVWYFYLTWLPAYLKQARELSAETMALVLVWPYLAADFGSIFGGWLSGFFLRRGWSQGRARLFTMGLFAFGMPGAIWAVFAQEFALSLALISLATCCHQAWSANVYTLVSDMFPKRAVGSVVGLGAMCGGIGGMFMSLVAGGILQWSGSYVPLFIIAGVMHPLAWVMLRLLGGKQLARVDVTSLAVQPSRPLLAGGLAVVAVGIALTLIVATRWQFIATSAKSVSTAAAGLVAALGVALLGALLVYASRGRPLRAG